MTGFLQKMTKKRYNSDKNHHTSTVQRKYRKSETGESMGVPNKKLKKLIMITGIALGVYAGLKYLLPLVIPFFIALGLAEAVRPWAEWLQKKFSFSIGKHHIQLPLGLIGGGILIVAGGTAGFFFFWGGGKILRESQMLFNNLPQLMDEVNRLLTDWCLNLEKALQLKENSMVNLAQNLLRSLGSYAASRMMPYLMGNSMICLRAAVNVAVFFVVLFFGTVMALQENEEIRGYFRRSVFHQEYKEMARILKVVGAAYGKTQIIILTGTIIICMAGLFLLGNPYYGLLGAVIGLLDALPFIGTGTVLFPWAAVCLLRHNTKQGAVLLGIYFVCYFLRQFLESRMMGREAGLSPFLTLAAIYIGIQLFGLLGVILGPLYFLILRESVDA